MPLNVAVIGAGIVGVSCAEWLRRGGMAVTLFDREGPAAGASFGNAGVLARCSVVPVTVPGLLWKAPRLLMDPMGPLFLRWSYMPRMLPWLLRYLANGRADPASRIAGHLAPLLDDAVEQHRALARGTPADSFIRDLDYMYLYAAKSDYEADTFGRELRRRAGHVGEEIETAALREFDPHLNPRYRFALRFGDHGAIGDPGGYVTALFDWFVAQGGRFERSQVDAIQPDGDKVLVTAAGESRQFDRVVVATGAWSRDLARRIGHRAPLEAERGYHMEFHGANRKPPASYMVTDAKVAVAPMDHALRLAGIVEFGGLTPRLSRGPQTLLTKLIKQIYPDIKYDHTTSWLGFRPAPPDSLPYLGASPRHGNILFGFGHHHVGLTGGAKTGRLLADMITGQGSNLDLRPYRVDRYD